MAGRRLARQAGTTQAAASAERRRRALAKKMAEAVTPDQQVAAAAAYLRSRLALVPAETQLSIVGALVDHLIDTADALPIRKANTSTGGTRP